MTAEPTETKSQKKKREEEEELQRNRKNAVDLFRRKHEASSYVDADGFHITNKHPRNRRIWYERACLSCMGKGAITVSPGQTIEVNKRFFRAGEGAPCLACDGRGSKRDNAYPEPGTGDDE